MRVQRYIGVKNPESKLKNLVKPVFEWGMIDHANPMIDHGPAPVKSRGGLFHDRSWPKLY